ncbi:MAG: hypothetical protein LBD59_09000 [Prevotellaceae bacterium]|jgi:hypothetical protein|nr:hypothetical protein [Prevotellaceae bacterium]
MTECCEIRKREISGFDLIFRSKITALGEFVSFCNIFDTQIMAHILHIKSEREREREREIIRQLRVFFETRRNTSTQYILTAISGKSPVLRLSVFITIPIIWIQKLTHRLLKQCKIEEKRKPKSSRVGKILNYLQ